MTTHSLEALDVTPLPVIRWHPPGEEHDFYEYYRRSDVDIRIAQYKAVIERLATQIEQAGHPEKEKSIDKPIAAAKNFKCIDCGRETDTPLAEGWLTVLPGKCNPGDALCSTCRPSHKS